VFDAILWDNDGILVDTEELYLEATRETLAAVGVELGREQFLELFLVEARGAWHLAAERGLGPDAVTALKRRRDRRYTELVAARPLLIDGAAWAVRALAARYPMAIVTSCRRAHFEVIHRATGILDAFATVVVSDDVARAKPDPEPYLLAAARLGVDPARCLALEDSRRGLTAAKAAGLTCWVIPRGLTVGQDFAAADRVLPSLAEATALLLGR
jgi:HAD superfamily hydrolase (TIGR01509 family)